MLRTTLAAVLQNAGLSNARSAELQRTLGVTRVDRPGRSNAYDPYDALSNGDPGAFSQVIAHNRLAGLLLLSTTLAQHKQHAPARGLEILGEAFKAAATSSNSDSASDRNRLTDQVLEHLLTATTDFSAPQRQGIKDLMHTISDQLDAITAYAQAFGTASLNPRTLLPAANTLKSTLLSTISVTLPDVLSGAMPYDALQEMVRSRLAGGTLFQHTLSADHIVSVSTTGAKNLIAGGYANFLISTGSPAPDQGLRLIASIEAPDGTSVGDHSAPIKSFSI